MASFWFSCEPEFHLHLFVHFLPPCYQNHNEDNLDKNIKGFLQLLLMIIGFNYMCNEINEMFTVYMKLMIGDTIDVWSVDLHWVQFWTPRTAR